MKILTGILLTVALACHSAWAAPDQKHMDKIRRKVSQAMDDGRHVSVETYDNRKFAGIITQAGPDSFVLTNAAGPSTISYSDVKKLKSPVDPHKRGLIAAAIVLGGLFGAVFAMVANDR